MEAQAKRQVFAVGKHSGIWCNGDEVRDGPPKEASVKLGSEGTYQERLPVRAE